MFKITESAKEFLLDVLNREKKNEEEKLFIRISMGTCWEGPKLSLSLEEQKLKDDRVYDFEKFEVLIHEKDMPYFNQTILDHIKDEKGNGKFQVLSI